jgi:hypothetical protein
LTQFPQKLLYHKFEMKKRLHKNWHTAFILSGWLAAAAWIIALPQDTALLNSARTTISKLTQGSGGSQANMEVTQCEVKEQP